MTTQDYMRRYHGCGRDRDCDGDCDCDRRDRDCDRAALTAEEVFPSCPLATATTATTTAETAAETEAATTRHHDSDDDSDDCCCRESLVDALRLLCSTRLSDLVDFNAFFFLTQSLSIGGALTVPPQNGTDPSDNISAAEATFRRFSSCNNSLLDVDATAFFASPGMAPVALTEVEEVSLCSLIAIAFDLVEADTEEEEQADYDRAVCLLRRELGTTCNRSCGSCAAHCDEEGCCCAESILRELSVRNLSRTATFTAGKLVLQNVTVLGSVGNVLVVANEDERRFYFVCANAIEVLG